MRIVLVNYQEAILKSSPSLVDVIVLYTMYHGEVSTSI